MTTWVPHVPHAPRHNTPMGEISLMVIVEIERLISEETYDEVYHENEVLDAGMRIASDREDQADRWDSAMRQSVYTLKEGELLDLLRDGDDCALGKVLREATIKEFAADVFAAAEEECGI